MFEQARKTLMQPANRFWQDAIGAVALFVLLFAGLHLPLLS